MRSLVFAVLSLVMMATVGCTDQKRSDPLAAHVASPSVSVPVAAINLEVSENFSFDLPADWQLLDEIRRDKEGTPVVLAFAPVYEDRTSPCFIEVHAVKGENDAREDCVKSIAVPPSWGPTPMNIVFSSDGNVCSGTYLGTRSFNIDTGKWSDPYYWSVRTWTIPGDEPRWVRVSLTHSAMVGPAEIYADFDVITRNFVVEP